MYCGAAWRSNGETEADVNQCKVPYFVHDDVEQYTKMFLNINSYGKSEYPEFAVMCHSDSPSTEPRLTTIGEPVREGRIIQMGYFDWSRFQARM